MKRYFLSVVENVYGVRQCGESVIYESEYFFVNTSVGRRDVYGVGENYILSCIFDALLVSTVGANGNVCLGENCFEEADLNALGYFQAKQISKTAFLGDKLAERPAEMFVYELGQGVSNVVLDDDQFCVSINDNGGLVFLRGQYGRKVICLNDKFELLWKVEFEKGWLPGYIEPTVYNELVVFNQFDDLVSLDVKTGDEVWRHTFDSVPTSCSLVGDKIYAVDRGDVVVLSSASGGEITRFNSGFQAINDITGQNNLIECFPFCEDIVISAGYEGCIKIVSEDGRDDFGTWKIDSYRPHNNGVRANELNGKLYLSVRNMNAYSRNGLLVLEKGHDGKVCDEVDVDERTNAQIFAYPSIHESHSIVMYFAPKDLYDAVIIGPLYVEEFYYATGYFPIFDGEQGSADHKHNGVIQLVIDPSNLEGDCGEALRIMEFEINKQIQASTVMAGDKKSPITFELTLKPKHDWSLDGERIDWPAIRELNEPIS